MFIWDTVGDISLHIAVLLMLEGNTNHLKTGHPKTVSMNNSEDLDEMPLLVKTQMKCCIKSGSSLFSKTNWIFRKEIQCVFCFFNYNL